MKLAELATLPELYGTADPNITHPVLDAIHARHDLAKQGASRAASRLILCRDMGLYDPLALTRIMDFGAGPGSSTFAVALLAEEVDATVDAVEELPGRAEILKNSGLTQSMPVRAHEAEAVEWLKDSAHNGKQFDLITACMFGPDFRGGLAKELLAVSREALVSGGKLLIYSDPQTMTATQGVCDETQVTYEGIKSRSPDIWTVPAFETIVITNP